MFFLILRHESLVMILRMVPKPGLNWSSYSKDKVPGTTGTHYCAWPTECFSKFGQLKVESELAFALTLSIQWWAWESASLIRLSGHNELHVGNSSSEELFLIAEEKLPVWFHRHCSHCPLPNCE
jgi:hypothetical protein